MDNATAIDIVRDTLRNHLIDPLILAGGTRGGLQYIYSDEPLTFKHPFIQLKKGRSTSEVLDIGSEYTAYKQVFLNIYFHTKNGFKITVNGVEYTNAKLVEYYLEQIDICLKGQFSSMFDQGVKNYKAVGTTANDYNPDTQVYYGVITVRVAFFRN